MKPIKIAQIGAEHDHASDIMRNLRKKNDIFEVVGYAIPDGRLINIRQHMKACRLCRLTNC